MSHQSQPDQSQPLTKPRALRPGATIAIVSPAAAAKPELVHAGAAHLQRLGYNPRLAPHALENGPLYYAGTLKERLQDLHNAFADPTVDAILCTRGGWGSAELLPHLDRALIRANPKPFIGYSDHTSLHIWLHNEANLVTFYGPMAAADFSRGQDPDLASWRHALHAEATSATHASPATLGSPATPAAQATLGISGALGAAATLRTPATLGKPETPEVPAATPFIPWSLGPAAGLRILQPGHAEGAFTGGCLSIYAESLGTPYAPRISGGDTPSILFLEDIGTKPYQWDRMLLHLRYAGLLANVTGIVFGDMRQCIPPNTPDASTFLDLVDRAILHALRDFSGPIAIGLRSGHVDHANITLPLGIASALDLTTAANPTLHLLEPAVAP